MAQAKQHFCKSFLKKLIGVGVLFALTLALFSVFNSAKLVIPTAAAQGAGGGGFCGSLSNEFQGFIDCEDDITSFTEFDGGLQQVDADGYDPNLTRAKDLRSLVKNIVNFALGFLGLIAVVAIIYGGFLYVTAAFDDGQAEQGKNTIKYSVIGIVMILASFAIVQTALRIPGNLSNNASLDGSLGANGAGNQAQVANFNGSADQVRKLTAQFISSYENYFNQVVLVEKMQTYRFDSLTTRQELIDYLSFLRRNLIELQNRSVPSARSISVSSTAVTRTGLAARILIDQVIDPSLRTIDQQIDIEATEEEMAKIYRSGLGRLFDDFKEFGDDTVEVFEDVIGLESNKRAEDINCFLPAEYRLADKSFDCVGAKESYDNEQKDAPILSAAEVKTTIDKALEELLLQEGIIPDFDERMKDLRIQLSNIRVAMNGFSLVNAQVPTPSTVDDLVSIEELIASAEQTLGQVNGEAIRYSIDLTDENSSLTTSDAFQNTEIIRKLVLELSDLYDALKNIRFVAAFIRASNVSGSAPLVVRFDASASLDPAERSLTNDKFEWDLNGDGDFTDRTTGCEENNSAVVGCVYKEPGSYRVALRVKSNEPGKFAPGLAYITIAVGEPVAKIELSAKYGNTTKVLRSYDDNGFITEDRDRIAVTLSDASKGIQFDTKGTAENTQSTGNKIIRYTWDFGDGTEKISGQTNEAITPKPHIYSKIGIYQGYLEVEDTAGNIDRKLFEIAVTSLAADLTANQVRGDLNTEFIFDASRSKSDGGRIKSYSWSISGGEETSEKGSTLKHVFTKPGTYTVSVTVEDNLNNRDQATVEILIESQAPKALYKATFVPNQPSTVLFDASDSFDPDEEDTLSFRWTFFNAREGIDYEIVEGKTSGNVATAGKIKVKFKRQDNFTGELTVSDQHSDQRLRKEVKVQFDVNIQSLVDLKLADSHQAAVILNAQGEAVASFEFESSFAKTAEIDFGDGQKEVGVFQAGKYSVKHTYKKAGIYTVKLIAGKEEDRNQFITTIVVSGGDTVVPVVAAEYDDLNYQTENLPIVARNRQIKFDAGKSLNTNGSNQGLTYSWNFGDGSFAEGQKVSHVYKELAPNPPGYFEVSLIVKNTQSKSATFKFNVRVASVPPTYQDIKIEALDPKTRSLVGTDAKLVTPFPVRVQALGVSDVDSDIKEYRFYYIPLLDPNRKLGLKTAKDNLAELTVDTLGVQGEKNDFAFCVDIVDSDGNEVNCLERFALDDLPRLSATNGKNEPPKADFSVDRTNINVGEEITFNSTSKDSDGQITTYQWDVDGDGSFANDAPQDKPVFTYKYTKKSGSKPFQVRLKVTDDKGGSAVSDPISIRVDSVLNNPVAAFTTQITGSGLVKFFNNSRADSANGGSITAYNWDFDTSKDSDGNGKNDDDNDSSLADPEFRYSAAGNYQAKLTVVDSEGNTDDVINTVVVPQFLSGNIPEDNLGTIPQSNVEAKLSTTPEFDAVTKTVNLRGESGNITFRFSQSRGEIQRIIIDKNIYFDTNSGTPGTPGDGIRNNDADFSTTDINSAYTTDFQKAWGPIEVQLTIIDKNGQVSQDRVKVSFSSGFAATLTTDATSPIILIILLALIGGVGVLYYDKSASKRSKSDKRKSQKLL